jgi:hypothetical protein
VRHGQDEFVRGDVHTNSVEGFWNLIKNGIREAIRMSKSPRVATPRDMLTFPIAGMPRRSSPFAMVEN